MTTEQESTEERNETETSELAPTAAQPEGLTRKAKIWSIVIAVVLVLWFFFAWLVMGQDVVDAAGESVGSALLLLLLASIISASRERDRQRKAREDNTTT